MSVCDLLLLFICRLATHYTYTVETCTLLLENVISDYLNFFKTKGLPIHTARVELTSLISTLFHVPLNSGSDFLTSEKYMYFQNVTPIPDSPSSSLQLPRGCRLTTTSDKEIQIMCPFYPSGGKQSSSYCTIALHWPNTILSFNNFTVSFDIQLRLQSDKIHGLISFVRQLRMCQGVKIVNAGGVKKIEHSEKCERIMLPLSGETCCESCVGLRALRERIIIGIGPGVITRQMLSLEHTHLAEKTCIPKKNKSKRTEIDFSTHGELHVLEQAAVSNRDTQHDLESADDYLGNCIELEVPENCNEKGGADMPMTADNNDFSELDGIFMTGESNTPATSENKCVTNVFAEDNKCKNHGQTNVDLLFKGCSEHANKNRIAMEEERIEETMTDSDCQSGEDADTNINNDIDEFETLKPVSRMYFSCRYFLMHTFIISSDKCKLSYINTGT